MGGRWINQDKPQGTPFVNPVFDHDAPDPSGALKGDDGYYYIVTTQANYENGMEKLPILRSQDLVHWEHAGQVFDTLPDWLDKVEINVWAPDFVRHDGKYYVYYAGQSAPNDDGYKMGIGVAVADDPLGPYVDKGEPIAIGPSFGTIDPFIFTDDDGSSYMYWGSDARPIRVQKLSEDGLSLVGESEEVLHVSPVKKYERLLEGPWVVKRGGYYYLFVSGDNCCGAGANYAVMVARSESPLGPFEKYSSVPGGGPILEANDRFDAPGHNSIVTDDAGQDWILYHAFDRNARFKGRILLMDKIDWKDGWPVINDGKGPSFTEQKSGPVIRKE
ncbi:family 43 glycosylhydrolase [Cohnella lubricantis]|uniref:Family 43 glycosylhydrolase n=1 Tax=Cohnella lubricantis TaxID=2163172 RepID=A0A841T827_9BACL|nr:family 43 glycosylhydrolase [Cohnella lubricantis]MBB6677474.1 family 43 glycosylhydrolase [Cohnella lubricantis]MBP2116640.1 arabinan endo-1,5-alpha-L-arabinosidase [Cohnella lubricantis]